jgi:hypothetical protein
MLPELANSAKTAKTAASSVDAASIQTKLQMAKRRRRLAGVTNMVWLGLALWVFIQIDRHAHSVSDTVRPVFIIWVAIAIVAYAVRRFWLK